MPTVVRYRHAGARRDLDAVQPLLVANLNFLSVEDHDGHGFWFPEGR
jgi:hypothetical protein